MPQCRPEILVAKDFTARPIEGSSPPSSPSERGDPIDLITLSNSLKDRKQLDSVGGAVYLARWWTTPSAANVAHYAKIIKNKASSAA